MVAPTGVNEGSPGEPVDTELAQGELPAGELADTCPAESADAEPAGAETSRTEPGKAEPGKAAAGEAEPGEAAGGEVGPELEPAEASRAEPRRDMSPLAVVGIVFGVIVLVGVAAGVLAVATHGFHKKTVITYRPAAVFRLHPGECINSGASGLAVTVLACGTPHDAEVFATFTLPASSWPGNAAVQQSAGNGCAARLDSYLKPALANAGLAQEYVYPNQAAWKAGERTVVCEVSSPSGQLTGSVRQGS
jgi:hypothetical protein